MTISPASTTFVPRRRRSMFLIEIFCEPRFTWLMMDGSRFTLAVFFDAITFSPKDRRREKEGFTNELLLVTHSVDTYANLRTRRLIK